MEASVILDSLPFLKVYLFRQSDKGMGRMKYLSLQQFNHVEDIMFFVRTQL